MGQTKQIITAKLIKDVVDNNKADRISIQDLINSMDGVGFGLTFIFFAFFVFIPLPPPVPSIVAVPMIFFSLQMIIGYSSPKLPKIFARWTIKRSILEIVVRKSSPYIYKIEQILRPRLLFMTSPIIERIIGLFLMIFSSFVLIPVPFSNLIPAFAILLTSFGMMSKDGLFIILGIITGVIGSIVSVFAITIGVEFLNYIKNYVF